ncbi:MAG: two-component system nitrogen regulation sensor histidine kinase NtrY [Polaribacter sp.]|jgi:two-component system nitrogen regulation sensor histidine kinase NtrY
MSLKVKYTLFIIIIHTLIGYLLFLLLEDQKLYFLLAEVAIIFSLFLSYLLYRSFIKPLDFIASGSDAIRDKDFNVKFINTGSNEMDKLINVYNEMIDSIRKERTQVEEQHYFLEKLIQASPAGIILLDYDNRISEVNPKAAELLQWKKEWLNQNIAEIDHPLLQQIATLPSGKASILQHKGIEQYKCEVSEFMHRGFHKKFILLQELSKEILAAEKRAYGKVIRMMAHEVNNSIGAINSILNTTLDYNEDSDVKLDPDIQQALEAAVERNDSLNQFMSNFAAVVRLPKPKFELCDLNEISKSIIALLSPQTKERNIVFQQELSSSPIRISLDPKQIEQALVNIIKNAMEAIEAETGIIRLETFASPRARIVISDNGSGINPEVAPQLFTPFFSTKMTGQGVGLTLIRDILVEHRAIFSLETVGEWTRFEIQF